MAALLPPFPLFRAFDSLGLPLAGGLLYTYAAGTTTPLTTYTDNTGTVPNSNPVVLDSTGSANVWLASGVAYKFLLEDSNGNVQPGYPVDNITGGLTGSTGAPGSVWYNGSGTPSVSLGNNGDYYLDSSVNTTTSGNVYQKSSGVWAQIGNILGPAGSNINRVVNGRFYQGLSPWITSGSVAPTLGTGSSANSGSAQQFADQSISLPITSDGSIAQAFSVQALSGTQTLTFNTACYLAGSLAKNANSGLVKVYLFDGQAATETLIGTYNLTAISSTPSWTAQSIDVTANLPALGDYGLRFEIQAFTDNVGGTAGTKGTYTAVDDIKLITSSAGTAGPAGPAGPTGPAGPAGAALQRVTFNTAGTYSWTVPTGVNWADITCVGAGGGGGGAGTTAGGGGGGGGAAVKLRVPVTPGANLNVYVGTGGGGGTAGNGGVAGGNTYVGTVLSPLCLASGGSGGVSGSGTTPGSGAIGGPSGQTIYGYGQGSSSVNVPFLTTGASSYTVLDPYGYVIPGSNGGNGANGASNGLNSNPVGTYAGGTGGASDGTRGGGGAGGSSAFGAGRFGLPSVGGAVGRGYGGGGGSNASGSNGAGVSGSGGLVIIEYVG